MRPVVRPEGRGYLSRQRPVCPALALAALTLASLAQVACAAVTQDLGNNDDAGVIAQDGAGSLTLDSSPTPDAFTRDSAPIADARACETCTAPDGPCIPASCVQQGRTCGPATDGCGLPLDCGTCLVGEICGGAGTCENTGGNCVPETCLQKGVACGPTGDGCGNLLQCGTCTGGMTCGGGGAPAHCGSPAEAGAQCTPETCAQQSVQCGPAGDGCGGLLQCGTCTAPAKCGGGGSGRCG
jgi:hypothetical protein